MIEQQILRFKISMYDTIFMNVLHTCNNLLHEFNGLRLIKSFSFDNIIEQLPTFCILHDKMNVSFRFDDFVELNDVRVTKYFKDTDLSSDSFDIRLFYDFLLL